MAAADPMPPGSWPWTYPLSIKQVVPSMIRAEARNLPRVLKEMMIVTTLGGLIAFIATLAILTRRRIQYPVEWRFAVVVAAGALILVTIYSTLVFDERYLFPLMPLVLAVAARFLVPEEKKDDEFDHDRWRILCIALVVLGTIASIVYPSSPFRLLTRDFQSSCYDAGRHPSGTHGLESGNHWVWTFSRARCGMGGRLQGKLLRRTENHRGHGSLAAINSTEQPRRGPAKSVSRRDSCVGQTG